MMPRFLSRLWNWNRRLIRRGYSLPEMAIALVVIGILVGGIVVPLGSRLKAEARLKTENLIYDAREAVLGYGIANRTVGGAGGVQIQAMDFNGLPHAMPEGRPYLPCPDVTGDGVEDRFYDSSSTFEQALFAGISPTLIDPTYIHYFNPLSSPPAGFNFRLGSCQEQKGLLPWRTLGLTEKGDSWGRQLGYWVDLAYSNRLLGFDEFSRADVSDPRRGYVAATLSGSRLLFYSSRQITSRSGVGHMNLAGGIVCSHLFKAGATGIDDADVGCPPARDKQTNLLAGIIHTHPGMVTLGARRIPAYAGADNQDNATGIVNGAAFVIFSHGPNGWGGVNAESGKCSPIPPDSDNLAERANAFYAAEHPLLATAGPGCEEITSNLLSENRFVASPPGNAVGEGEKAYGGDDIVIWTSPQALFGAFMQAGALPIPKLGFAPEGQ